MKRAKKFFGLVAACLLTVFTLAGYMPVKNASAKVVVPEIEFASPPVTEYTAGDRVSFNIHAPNYGGRVQYRVVLWNDSKKTYYDLWNASNGYPSRYYTKWQPYGNNIFTLGWIIFEPGSYRITVYAKRAGIANNKTALKGFNSDSYMESEAFYVKSNEIAVDSILPLDDVTVMQGATPTLPTKVKAAMSDNLIKELGVTWPTVNTTNPGTQTIQGTVEGTTKKAAIKINVTGQSAINVNSVVSVSNYLVNVTLRDSIYAAPEASKFGIKSYNSSTTIPIQSVSLSSDKKTVSLTTGYMAANGWYTLTVNNNSYNFIANQGTGNVISIAAQNKEVTVGGTVYAAVAKYPSDVSLTYYSSNTAVAAIDQSTGLITGKYPGVATITVYGNKYGYSQVTTTFTVTVGGQSGMYAYATNMELGVGSQQMPSITKYPSDLTLYFTSSNSNIASINYYSGLVTGVAPGTATITIAASKSGYTTLYSTFTVTVRSQGMSLFAAPAWLYESMANDGSLKSGVIDLILTGSTFNNLGYYYYESYVDITNLPYGMSYDAAYVNSNTLRVTLTGKAYLNRNLNDATISIVVSKDIVNGASYDLAANNVVLDFTDDPIPDAPTNPTVNDVLDTFGWTKVPNYTSISDYEYRVKNGSTWSSWMPSTANPQPVGDNSYAVGGVEVRVKAATGRNAGYALASNMAFTMLPDSTKPVLGSVMTIKFKDDTLTRTYSLNSENEYVVPVEAGKEITEMNLTITETHPDTQDVPLKIQGTQTTWGILKYTDNGNWKLTANPAIPINDSVILTAIFKDTSVNSTTAVIKINFGFRIVNINDITNEVEQYESYTMPTTVKAQMSGGDPIEKDVNVSWDKTIYTYPSGVYEALGTVTGYAPKVKLTVKVIPKAPTNPIIDDVNNTFDWTYAQGFYNLSDYEYSVDRGASWSDITTKPQQLFNAEYAIGAVQIRVKESSSPLRPAGKALVSDKAFTKDTPIDNKNPEIRNLIMTFKDSGTETYTFVNGSTSFSIPYGAVLNSMSIEVSDENLDTSDRVIYQRNASGSIERTWGVLKYNQNNRLWELSVANPSQFFFDVEREVKLYTVFYDTQGNFTVAYININVFVPI